MGIGYDEFWTFNPRKLNVYVEGYKLRRKIEDEKQWMLGGYIFEAVSIAMANAFRKKNDKPVSYFEERKEPFLSESSEELSESKKQMEINALMANLHMMQNNFAINHGK